MARRRPTEEGRIEALRRLLAGLVEGADVFELAASISDLHPKNDTFPGEVFMGLAADALEIADGTRDHPIPLRACARPTCQSVSSGDATTARSNTQS